MTPNPPNLDEELTKLSREEAYRRVKSGLSAETGLSLRFFSSGVGEWWEYYRANPDGDGMLRWRSGHGVQKQPVVGDLLRVIGVDVFDGSDELRDIWMVPMERMPEWGDGTAHYSCHSCRKPIQESNLAYRKSNWYHTECAPVTKTALRNHAEAIRDDIHGDVVGRCRKLANDLADRIREQESLPSESVSVVDGSICFEGECGTHWYVSVSSDVVYGASQESESVIVDPSVSQFTKKNYFEYGVEVVLSPRAFGRENELPNVVVLDDGAQGFDLYQVV